MNTQLLKKVNLPLVILPILLFTIGYITLSSTSPELSKNHLLFFSIGAVLYYLFASLDYRIWTYLSKYIYGISVLALITTFLLGQAIFGSSRWLQIGALSLQPSEFVKIALLVVLAGYFSVKEKITYKELFYSALMTVPLVILVLIQPNLSTSLILLAILVALLWFSNLDKTYFILAAIVAGLFSTPMWNFLQPYQQERILTFINPSVDTLGSGYNVIQSTIAVGSGEFWGRGFGRGTQSHLKFLPVYWTDFIFAAFAEEWGFIGVVSLLLIYGFLLFYLLKLIFSLKEDLGRFIISGAFVIFFSQFVINVGMNLGLMPVTGVPLPLVSYGGSSMLSTMMLLGLVQSVWIHKKV